jgi:hypothetical protein
VDYFVEVKWDGRDRGQIQKGISYIAHREERLEGGRTRDLYGIGDRYKALRGGESRIADMLDRDGSGLRAPRYHRMKLTVDDEAAGRFARLPPDLQERVLRDAVERTFRGELRRAQGVFVAHAHGGRRRPSGHPHVHVRLSPLMVGGHRLVITAPRLERFKERWFVEVNRGLDRALARTRPDQPERSSARERTGPGRDSRADAGAGKRPSRGREGDGAGRHRRGGGTLPTARGLALLGLGLGRGSVRVLAPGVAEALRARDDLARGVRDPGKAITRAAFRLATRALPEPFRAGLGLARVVGRLRQDR